MRSCQKWHLRLSVLLLREKKKSNQGFILCVFVTPSSMGTVRMERDSPHLLHLRGFTIRRRYRVFPSSATVEPIHPTHAFTSDKRMRLEQITPPTIYISFVCDGLMLSFVPFSFETCLFSPVEVNEKVHPKVRVQPEACRKVAWLKLVSGPQFTPSNKLIPQILILFRTLTGPLWADQLN